MLNKFINKWNDVLVQRRGKIIAFPSLSPLQSNRIIGAAIANRRPYLVGRMGWTEGYTIGQLLSHGKTPATLREKLHFHSGVFPPTEKELRFFSDSYLRAASAADMLGLLQFPLEGWLLKKYAPHAATVDLGSLEPYFSEEPWSFHLQGLTVLVVHPFAASIQKQYASVRQELFANPKVLPEFELKVIQAPQTITDNPKEYASWTETLKSLEQKITRESFDVAIIGCGAYGLPLGAFVKSIGKIGIHLGGAAQLLFGIAGTRWLNNPQFKHLITPAWCRPLLEEQPLGWEKNENGCYW
ncbi:MAG: hypothetical protein ACOYK6_05495 [Chthoniobacterales bacterium]